MGLRVNIIIQQQQCIEMENTCQYKQLEDHLHEVGFQIIKDMLRIQMTEGMNLNMIQPIRQFIGTAEILEINGLKIKKIKINNFALF